MTMIQDLRELTSNILETMFFLMEETEPFQIEFNYKYAVNIKDEFMDIIMMFGPKTAVQMAENFMGTDDISVSDISDTLKEAINIIVGNLIRQNMQQVTTKVSIPVMIENLATIKPEEYQTVLLFYNDEPLNLLIKTRQ